MSSQLPSQNNDNVVDPREDYKYCVDLVRDRDREAYLCGLLFPASVQQGYFAIRAFNVEIASIRDPGAVGTPSSSSSPPLLLQIRMQWWREALDEIYETIGEGTDHRTNSSSSISGGVVAGGATKTGMSPISKHKSPVVRSLHRAVEGHNLTRRFLERLLDARRMDLDREDSTTLTLDHCIEYAEETVSSLLYLNLELAGIRDDKADAVASVAGVGIGLTTALRATPGLWQRYGYVPIPSPFSRDQVPRFEVFQQALLDWRNGNSLKDSHMSVPTEDDLQKWQDSVQLVTEAASHALRQAQMHQSDIPRSARMSLLHMIPALHYVRRLQNHANGNILDPQLHDPNTQHREQLRLLLHLGWAGLTKII